MKNTTMTKKERIERVDRNIKKARETMPSIIPNLEMEKKAIEREQTTVELGVE